MESDATFKAFREKRRKFLKDWNRLNDEIEEVLDKLEETGPTALDAAFIEGLRAERHRLLEDYENVADAFTAYLLRLMREGRR